MKMRVRSLAFGEDSFKINVDRKSRVIYKWFDQISPSFKPGKDMRRITLHMRHTTNCTCDVVNTKKTPYLVTGWKQGNKYMIHYITKWQKRTKRIVKVLRKKRCMRAYRITRNNRNANWGLRDAIGESTRARAGASLSYVYTQRMVDHNLRNGPRENNSLLFIFIYFFNHILYFFLFNIIM